MMVAGGASKISKRSALNKGHEMLDQANFPRNVKRGIVSLGKRVPRHWVSGYLVTG
jgi:hypothetical protein